MTCSSPWDGWGCMRCGLTPCTLPQARRRPPAIFTTLTANRLFGIGDPLVLERRAQALAKAASVPLESLDLAFANLAVAERANLAMPPDSSDASALEHAQDALEL